MKLAFDKSTAIAAAKYVGIPIVLTGVMYVKAGVVANQVDRYHSQSLHNPWGHVPYGWQTWFEYEPTAEDIKHAEKPAEKDNKKPTLYPAPHR